MINYFNFKKYKDKILITNDLGFYAFLDPNDFSLLIKDEMKSSHPLYSEMINKRFLLEGNAFVSTTNVAEDFTRFKWYLRQATSLHIFVLTNICNMHCRYCQAQSENNDMYGLMTKDTARKAVDIALQSPVDTLTFEMQGGEPLINYEVIKDLIEYAEAHKGKKSIIYMITTNGTLINDEIIEFFKKYKVSVSVSLDGSQRIQQYNRPMNNGEDSYKYIERNIPLLKANNIFGGAVLTSTNYSLLRWKEIIDTYNQFECNDIFVRPLTPLGFAQNHWDQIGYSVEEFLIFYKEVMDYIIEKNKQGILMREMHAMIFLRKMLFQISDNYMELRSPCGATLGQIAYYYDGNIYTCDEGRMIAQMGDDAFCLGNVNTSSYSDLINCESCKAVCKASILEGLPGCSDCVYAPYCATCPATTYALEHSLLSRTNKNYRCKIYSGIINILFELLMEKRNVDVFKSWFRA